MQNNAWAYNTREISLHKILPKFFFVLLFTISVIINVRLRDFKVDCEPWVLSDDIDEVLVSSEIVNNINSLNEVGHIHNDRWSLWFTIFIKVDSDGAVGL